MPSVVHQPYKEYLGVQNVGLVTPEEICHRGEGKKYKKILELKLVHQRNVGGTVVVVVVVVAAAAAQGTRMSCRDALHPNWPMVVMTSICHQEYFQFQEAADQASEEIPPHVSIRQQMNLQQHNDKCQYWYVDLRNWSLHCDDVGSQKVVIYLQQ